MSRIMQRTALPLVSLTVSLMVTPLVATSSSAREVLVVKEQPPAPKYAVVGLPREGRFWLSGHWNRVNDRWIWVEGRWERPLHPSALWEPGYWAWRPHGWTWRPGRWVW
jgi:hypothetical protein